MRGIRGLCALLTLVSGVMLSGCGGSSRTLESISLSPNPATAKGGSVQMVATGTYSSAPVTVTPLTVNWNQISCSTTACPTSLVLGPVSINSSGLATCAQGYSGTVAVHVTAPADPSLPVNAENTTLVTGTAKVVCP